MRQSGGGSAMMWGPSRPSGRVSWSILEGKQNSEKHIYTLSEHLLPFVDRVYGRDCLFHNGPIHVARIITDFFADQNVTVTDWPLKSPDLNPIDDMWGSSRRLSMTMDGSLKSSSRLYKSVRPILTKDSSQTW